MAIGKARYRRSQLVLLLLTTTALSSCREPKQAKRDIAAEIGAAEQRLQTREARLATETCDQVPWGEPIVVDGTDLIHQLLQRHGLLAQCHEAITAVHGNQQKPSSVRDSCAMASEHIARLARSTTGCSPRAIGGPDGKMHYGGTTEFYPIHNIAQALSVEARSLAAQGGALEAAILLLQGMRFTESVRLGGVDSATEEYSLGASRLLFESLIPIALTTDWKDDERKDVIEALARLIRADTGPSDLARTELLKLRGLFSPDTPELKLWHLQSIEQIEELRSQACPADRNYQQCLDALVSLDKGLVSGTVTSTEKPPADVSKTNNLFVTAGLSYRTETLRLRGHRLAGLLALESALRSQQEGACPTRPLTNALGAWQQQRLDSGLVVMEWPFGSEASSEILRYRCRSD